MDSTIDKGHVSVLTMAALLIAALAARINAAAEALVPEGYEDATGFHFGQPSFSAQY